MLACSEVFLGHTQGMHWSNVLLSQRVLPAASDCGLWILLLCRENKFAQQQQVASKLQRLTGPEEPYIWWIICSLILQARAAVQGNHATSSTAAFDAHHSSFCDGSVCDLAMCAVLQTRLDVSDISTSTSQAGACPAGFQNVCCGKQQPGSDHLHLCTGAASPMSPVQLLKLADGMIVKQKQRFEAAWTYEETILYVGVLQVSLFKFTELL